MLDSADYFDIPITNASLEKYLEQISSGFRTPQRVRLPLDQGGKLDSESSPFDLLAENRPLKACQARLTINDTGIGIPPEDLPHLFERFHRGRNTSEYAGNGLGLAIVNGIVSTHGGNVSVQSEPGQGTQVRVSIPIDLDGPK